MIKRANMPYTSYAARSAKLAAEMKDGLAWLDTLKAVKK